MTTDLATPEAGAAAPLPHWDMTPVFPGLESREFAVAHEGILSELGRLVTLFDRHDVRGGAPRSPTAADVAAFEEIVEATNELRERLRTLRAYVGAHITTDSGNDRAATLHSRLQAETADLTRLGTRFDAWVARLGADALIAASPVAADNAYPLRRSERTAAHLMSEAEESLFADLNLTGAAAWDRLHGDVTSRLTATLDRGKGVETVPITVARGLAYDADGGVRERAFRAELAAWETVGVPLAAALNSIKGQGNAVNRRRQWTDSLEPSLHVNGVDRDVVQAMQAAGEATFADFRRYLRAKARLLGHADGRGLPWWDLFAPVGGDGSEVDWTAARSAVLDAFSTYSPQLRGLAQRAFDEQWVDAEAREGKEGGAFCMSVRADESRILLNFDGSFSSVQTLAHELGHAYHNVALAPRTPMQRATPMALAETASIFCETIMTAAGLVSATDQQRLAVLELDLQNACQVVVDIHSRFLFERSVFDDRVNGTLSVRDLNARMTEAQLATYGDGLDADTLHPYMWAVKPHYYSTAYYNWPYTFGLLFGLGLFARYQADPGAFRANYDDLLSSTGLGSAAELGARFGIDITSRKFWDDSLAVIVERIDDFCSLVDRLAGPVS